MILSAYFIISLFFMFVKRQTFFLIELDVLAIQPQKLKFYCMLSIINQNIVTSINSYLIFLKIIC